MAITAGRFMLWRDILSVARHAPSPHNVQPWRIKLLSDHEAELYIDGGRTLPNEDFTGSFLLSAMGMFMEAISLLAAPHGLHLDYRMHHSPDWYAAKATAHNLTALIPFAHLHLIPSTVVGTDLCPSLFLKRRTCRTSLLSTPVEENAVAKLSALASEWGHRYVQTNDSKQIDRILARNIAAVFHDMNVPGYRDEITSWFRFTNRAARRRLDGLDWRCMNLSRTEFWLSARFPWLLLFPPTHALLSVRYRRQLGVVPSIGFLSGDFFMAGNAVHSGSFLMRFWLETAKLGLYLHPYGNLVTNQEAAAWLRTETGLNNIWLVFKLGYAEEPPASYRRSLDDILVS